MSSKRNELSAFIRSKAYAALCRRIVEMSDRDKAEAIRDQIDYLVDGISYEICCHYSFVELADIMEWKRTRVRK